jgi:hypothetical protein
MTKAGIWAAAAIAIFVTTVATPQDGDSERKLVWTCRVHREVTEEQSGQCPMGELALVPTLVQTAWACPIHAVVVEREPGQCPICKRDLFLITEEVRFACPMHPEESSHEPGNCSICNMALVESTSTRPHQDHNPKHGGMFFMAPDNWHHLEGAYPEDGVFRVYLYDNFSEPMNAREFEGRAVLEEIFDADTKKTREIVWYPLVPSADGAYLEADVGRSSLPREITAKIRFESGGELERFDFIFADLSVDAPGVADPTALGGGDELVIPATPAAIAAAIAERNVAVRELVTSGAMDEIYLPALEAKDLAVALEAHLDALPEEEQRELQWALKQLVRSAWLLDDYGDLGNREKVRLAYAWFDEAVEAIGSVYR